MNIPNANVSEKQIRFQPKVAVSVILILCRHIGAKYSFSTTRHLEHKILRYKTPVYQHFTTSHLEMKNWRQLFVLQACQQTCASSELLANHNRFSKAELQLEFFDETNLFYCWKTKINQK